MDNIEHDIIIRKIGKTYHLLLPELGLISSSDDLGHAHEDITNKKRLAINSYQKISANNLLQNISHPNNTPVSLQHQIIRFGIKSFITAFLVFWVLLFTLWFGNYFTTRTISKADGVIKGNIGYAKRSVRDTIREIFDVSNKQLFWVEIRNNMREARDNQDPKIQQTNEAKLEVLQMTLEDLRPYLLEIQKSFEIDPEIQ
jgi:hypothetical protein